MTDLAPDAIVVALTTIDNEAAAAVLARSLVDEGLAACVNLVKDIRSIYRWQGQVEDASECLLVIKTSHQRLDQLTARVHALHPYETPEWLVLEAASVSEAWGKWLLAQV